MMSKFYTSVAYGTLFVSTYLALVSIASRAGVRYLPPFGAERVSDASRFLVILVATWMTVLSFGCLRAGRTQAERPYLPGVVWFVLVLGLAWLVVVLPALRLFVDLLWSLFLRGM